ncbi:hypothetical protein SERLA73DRAFT_172176 [Serpula lacrymans var. lacrymans S7.3]|uniref:Gaa1-domain-containing protein n=2 Tax=Serpula lacrymans var. lacrymans TaxID=341189 RepID=F8QEK1_SERL3|nr:uncharacterized protein SERLADRAFT_375063 [Serpula lacrymans var. lacrymans S7.9]EGN93257.1 hypothetical protein SERLA73DRAFT_172176 [Serpula lacrymans var. lacrymans S7.3]EGO18641.1 hypothetical protein SERLADRAFT_375063 [Serpula lacrymans var. lacrymans S7.9]
MERIRAFLKRPSAARVQRRKAFASQIHRRLSSLIAALFAVGFTWMIVIPHPSLSQRTYIDENALQPGQVNPYWNWVDVHRADQYLYQLEALRDANSTSEERAGFFQSEFRKLGLVSSTQNYEISTSSVPMIRGSNAYAILSSPRASGTEALLISASWISRQGEGDGTLNLRGIATVLSLAGFLKGYSLWAKDIIFVISDGHLEGMHAWLSAYHGVVQSNLKTDSLQYSSGVIWTALNIDYPGHSFSRIGIFHEGLNGRLPNQDFLNCLQVIGHVTGGVPVSVYDYMDSSQIAHRPNDLDDILAWIPAFLRENYDVREYVYRARNVARFVSYQARGKASGLHGLLHQFRIDAITIFAVPASGPHGFHALGRIIESSLRTMNNLLERLHASFFFYILTSSTTFMKIGMFLPSTVIVSVAMIFRGLGEWVDAGWVLVVDPSTDSSKVDPIITSPPENWVSRRRPVLPALALMTFTHFIGILLFFSITNPLFFENQKVYGPLVFAIACLLPLITPHISPSTANNAAMLTSVLKALNLCFASTVISITCVLNFSLATMVAVLLGIPLIIAAPSSTVATGCLKYAAYCLLALGWVLVAPITRDAIWNWEVLGVWFAPFMCIVFAPLVLQAGVISLYRPLE